MELANQSRIALSGCKLDDLQVQRVTIKHLGFNSRYHILLEGTGEQLLRQSFFEDIVSIKLYQHTGTSHYHGELLTLTQQYIKRNVWTWQLELGCSLHRLDNESGHHLFVDNTVQEIIEALFEASAISCHLNIKGPMPKLPYTAQGGVSDYDFFMRLCVEHGLVFFYRHQPSGSELYLTDEPQAFQSHLLQYNPANGMNDHQPVITHMTSSQVSLPDHVRLRAYHEEDISNIWETTTRNETGIPGSGIINLTLTQSLQSQKDCDQRARLLQQQLDWQRETVYIETSASQLQPADCVEISQEGQSKRFMVFDVCSSLDEAPQEGEPHPFKQKACLLPVTSVYKPPSQATRLHDLNESEEYLPQGWMASYQKPRPSLQMAVIVGDKDNQVQIDEQGRYRVKPLFDQNNHAGAAGGHYVRQAQPGAGLPKDKPQGMHLPLTPNTRVILGHLDDQIDKPFILGVYPDREQIASVNHYNLEMLSLKHRNGSGLEFSETSQKNQSIHLFTEENEHGIKLQSTPEEETIHAKSKMNMHLQSKKDSYLSSKQASIRNDHFHFEAEEDFSLVSQETMDIESGGNLSFSNGQDWQLLSQSGEFSSESAEKLRMEGKNIALYAPHIQGKAAKVQFHAGQSLNFTAAKSLGLEAGESQAIFSDNSIGFKAQKITISANTIKLHQGGMANSGAVLMPEIETTSLERNIKPVVENQKEQAVNSSKKETNNFMSYVDAFNQGIESARDETLQMIRHPIEPIKNTLQTIGDGYMAIADMALGVSTEAARQRNAQRGASVLDTADKFKDGDGPTRLNMITHLAGSTIIGGGALSLEGKIASSVGKGALKYSEKLNALKKIEKVEEEISEFQGKSSDNDSQVLERDIIEKDVPNKSSPSVVAKGFQGSRDYPGIDKYRDITLKKGTIVYAGEPGVTGFFTTSSAMRRSNLDATALFEGLQVSPRNGLYRPGVTAFKIIEDTPAAFGITRANPKYGAGGLPQVYIPNYANITKPVISYPLSNRLMRGK